MLILDIPKETCIGIFMTIRTKSKLPEKYVCLTENCLGNDVLGWGVHNHKILSWTKTKTLGNQLQSKNFSVLEILLSKKEGLSDCRKQQFVKLGKSVKTVTEYKMLRATTEYKNKVL